MKCLQFSRIYWRCKEHSGPDYSESATKSLKSKTPLTFFKNIFVIQILRCDNTADNMVFMPNLHFCRDKIRRRVWRVHSSCLPLSRPVLVSFGSSRRHVGKSIPSQRKRECLKCLASLLSILAWECECLHSCALHIIHISPKVSTSTQDKNVNQELKFFLLSRFRLVFLPTTLASLPPGVMLLNRSTTPRDSTTNIKKTSQKDTPERERPNISVVKIWLRISIRHIRQVLACQLPQRN